MNRPGPLTRLIVYTLLVVGSALFALPFFWMASNSVKVDREVLQGRDNQIRILPQWPLAQTSSPYVDGRYYEDLSGPYQKELLPRLADLARSTGFVLPQDVAPAVAWPQIGRGIYDELRRVLPDYLWLAQTIVTNAKDGELGAVTGRLEPDAAVTRLMDQATRKVDRETVAQVFSRLDRRLQIGPLIARNFDIIETQLDAELPLSRRWNNLTPVVARLRDEQSPTGQPIAVLHYDFSKGDKVVLEKIYDLPFEASELKRLEWTVTPDDTWHELTCRVDTAAGSYTSRRAAPMANFSATTITWQKPTADDDSTKIKTWIVLDPMGSPPPLTLDSNQVRVTLTMRQVSRYAATLEKVHRNYQIVFDQIPIWRYLRVSAFLVVINILLTLLFSSLAAYAFARLHWPGRDLCFVLMLATMMIPPQVIMIPHFLIWKHLGFYNTLTPLWLGSVFGSAFFIFLLRQFMKGVPRDLEDAARIDGCSFWGIYWYVFLPLMKPALAAIAIFTFMGTWNDFMGPLIYVADQRLYPLAFGLYAFAVQVGNNPALTMAASLLMTLPIIAVFFFAQKYFIQGISLTGIKG